MQDADRERPIDGSATVPGPTEPPVDTQNAVDTPRVGRLRGWPLVLGLTGLLGAVWAVAIASRYQNILPS